MQEYKDEFSTIFDEDFRILDENNNKILIIDRYVEVLRYKIYLTTMTFIIIKADIKKFICPLYHIDSQKLIITTPYCKYYVNKKGKFHRENDLPAIKYVGGRVLYYENGIKIKYTKKLRNNHVNSKKCIWKEKN